MLNSNEKVVPLTGDNEPQNERASPPPIIERPRPVEPPPPLLPPQPNPADLVANAGNSQNWLTQKRRKIILYTACGLFVAQLLFPQELKPVGILGATVGSFWEQVIPSSTNAARIKMLEESLASIEARRGHALGNCTFADIIGMGAGCRQLINNKFDAERAPVDSELESLRPKSFFDVLGELFS